MGREERVDKGKGEDWGTSFQVIFCLDSIKRSCQINPLLE